MNERRDSCVAPATAWVDPAEFPIYEQVTFAVTIRLNEPVYGGSIVEVQLPNSFTNDRVSPSKVKSWQTDDPQGAHHVRVKVGRLRQEDYRVSIAPREYVGGYSATTRHGRCVAVELLRGCVDTAEEIIVTYQNTTSPWIANQSPGSSDHEGLVLVMIDGKRVEPSPAFRVRPGPAVVHRLIVPSSARPGDPFPVRLISLDAFNNLSGSSLHGGPLLLGDTVVGALPDGTGRTSSTVALREPGVVRLTFGELVSNPIRIGSGPAGPYWGDIHFHNYPSVDAVGNIPYEYARNVSCLDFAATSEHGAGGLKEHWAQTRRWAREWHDPDAFVTILALETNTKWHHNIYFYDDDVPVVDSQKDGGSSVSPEQLLEYIGDKRVVTQIHHTGWGFDMRRRYPDTTRLFEIYSMHGTSELYDPESSLFMDKHRNRAGDSKDGPFYARDAWALGQRFATHGSSDNHFGQPGVRHNSVTALHCTALRRENVLDALAGGRCYATTGERILLDFSIGGAPMGSEISAARGARLDVRVEVHGTAVLGSVEVFACPFIEGNRAVAVNELMFAEDDPAVEKARRAWTTAFEARNIGEADASFEWTLEFEGAPTVLYTRITQRDPITLPGILEGQDAPQQRSVAAWSSPIWVIPSSLCRDSSSSSAG